MRILQILEDTMVDGPGFRTAIYCAGCRHACPGCHNPQSWPMDGGSEMTIGEIMAVVEADPFANVTFTGGDPMYQAAEFAELARTIKSRTGKTIWCFTGFLFADCLADPSRRALLETIDVLVDGPFILSERDTDLRFRGSRNQRLIDVPRSLEAGEVVEWNG